MPSAPPTFPPGYLAILQASAPVCEADDPSLLSLDLLPATELERLGLGAELPRCPDPDQPRAGQAYMDNLHRVMSAEAQRLQLQKLSNPEAESFPIWVERTDST